MAERPRRPTRRTLIYRCHAAEDYEVTATDVYMDALEAERDEAVALLRKARGKLQMYPLHTRRRTTVAIDAFLKRIGGET